jgi:hypothetical protein
MTRSAATLARQSAMVGVGGVLAYAGLIVLLVGLGWLLADVFDVPWLGLVLVGGIVLAIGGFLAWRSLQQMKDVSVVPEKTVETIKQDVEWAKEQTQ